MREPIIREVSLPPKVAHAVQIRLASLAAAVRSLKPQKPPQGPAGKRRPLWPLAVTAGVLLGALVAVFSQETPEPWVVSGSPKLKHTEDGDVVRWHKSKLDLTIDPSFEALHPRARDAVLSGFDAWHAGDPNLPQLTFDFSSTARKAERDGVNLVTYEEIQRPGYAHALAITVAYSEPSSGRIVEVDIIINARHEFGVLEALDTTPTTGQVSDDAAGSTHASHKHDERGHDERGHDERGHDEQGHCLRDYDLQSVVAHEAGHFFGLGEDEDETEATMYFKTARCDIRQRDLIETDVEAVRTVYSEALSSETDDSAAQAAACAVQHGGRPAPWALAFAVLGLAGLWRRTRVRRSAA